VRRETATGVPPSDVVEPDRVDRYLLGQAVVTNAVVASFEIVVVAAAVAVRGAGYRDAGESAADVVEPAVTASAGDPGGRFQLIDADYLAGVVD